MHTPPPPEPELVRRQVQDALAEDIGSGDLSAGLLEADAVLTAEIRCREDAVLCGIAWADAAFTALDTSIRLDWQAADGDVIMPGTTVCRLAGPARGILSAERTALNFLQFLSGVATQARRYARAVADRDVRLLDTRKTLPNLRAAQKYAIRCGGCDNHRMGLYDAIMLKENHLAGHGIGALVRRAREQHPGVPVIVEVETLAQLDEAAAAGADRALLDNFPLERLAEAAAGYRDRIALEASGNVTLENLRSIAETGVHCISIGALGKHVQAIDFSLRVIERG
jgi:nicotinate-nucleotide pyrophosphorylase (carboxylating)